MTQQKETSKQNLLETAEKPQNSNYQIISCIAVFLISLFILWWNAAPSITFHDSSEFAIAAASAGIPHPPGAPTWTALASLFIRIGAFTDPARGTNLFSGLFGAITLALIYLVVQMWTSRIYPSLSKFAVVLAGLASVAVLLHSSAFLEQSFMTEQYTLLTAFISAMLLVSTLIIFNKDQATDKANKNPRLFALLGLFWGLAIGNHLSQVSLVFLVAWVIWAGSVPGSRLKSASWAFAGLATGLLIFLWVPIRSHANPLIDFGNIKTWDRFIWAIERKAWHYRSIGDAPPGFIHEWLKTYAFSEQIGIIAIGCAVIGFFALLKKRPVLAGWVAMSAIPYAVGMIVGHLKQQGIDITYIVSYGVIDWHLPIYMAIAIFSGIGIAMIADLLRNAEMNLASLFIRYQALQYFYW